MDAADPGGPLFAEDVAFGFVAGVIPELRWPQATCSPSVALRAALRPALERTPCVIGFSGGRDSSLLLALAVDEARRGGFDPPVAVTLEFESEKTHEREWQELVASHLGLRDWLRLPQGRELDLVGPVAGAGLRRHGVLYPGNAHMVVPLAAVARGGSVVTGFAGDDVLGEWPFEEVAAVLAGRRRPGRRDLRAFARWVAPATLRTDRYANGRGWVRLPWLREPHARRAAQRIAADIAGSPRMWSDRMRWLARRRIWPVSQRAMDLHAAQHGARTYAPLRDSTFLSALGQAGGRLGLGDRTALMRLLAAGLLPSSLLERATKAEFSEPYFGPDTKRFAVEWDGHSGIDPDVVDAEALRSMWLSGHPHALSAALLQSTWLATQEARDRRQSRACPRGMAGNG